MKLKEYEAITAYGDAIARLAVAAFAHDERHPGYSKELLDIRLQACADARAAMIESVEDLPSPQELDTSTQSVVAADPAGGPVLPAGEPLV